MLGVRSGGVHNPVAVYDDARIRERSRLIIVRDRRPPQRFPQETPYRYAPLAGEEARYRWTPAAKAEIKDYNLLDLGI